MIGLLAAVFSTTFALGFPIFLVLVISSAVVLLLYFPSIPLEILVTRMVGGINVFNLLALPFFMYAAEIVSRGEIGRRLVNLSRVLVGHLPGGMAMTTVLTCTLFGAISGAGVAAIVAIGTLVIPTLLEEGYGEKFSLGLLLSSSTIAMLIPPGIAMILYAILTNTSVAAIFIAGLSAGLVMSLAFMVYSYIFAVRHRLPRRPRATVREVVEALRHAGWALGLPILVLGGIYGGLFSPTEAAGASAVYAMVVEAFVYRKMSIRDLYRLSARAGANIAMLMILIAAGSILAWVMTISQIPQTLTASLSSSSPFLVLLFINVIFLVAGMFVDVNSAIVVLTPLLFPLSKAVGIDPIHLGMIIVTNLTIAMLTPPFGMGIFVANGVFGTPYHRIVPGVIPFIGVMLVVLLIVTYAPGISLWLPRAFGY